MNSNPKRYGSCYYRNLLTMQGKMVYDQVNAQMLRNDYSGVTQISNCNFILTSSDCFAAYHAIIDDHPEYFFLDKQSKYMSRGNNVSLQYQILYSENQIQKIKNQLRKYILYLNRGTTKCTEIEKEKIVYERIANVLKYNNSGSKDEHNIVGPVMQSRGVCEGYNALLLLAFRSIGIPCIKIYGTLSSGVLHCWTIAWIGGIPVHCDVTGDRKGEAVVGFHYFNLSDKQLCLDHFDFMKPNTPRCLFSYLSYYRYYAVNVKSLQELCVYMGHELKKKSQIYVHVGYTLPGVSLVQEVKNAYKISDFNEKIHIYANEKHKNVVITRK